MNWKDKLLPASFRGVPFKTHSDEATFGRRTQVHEYPGRDKPWCEDLGRAVRRDTVSAYVIGDDYQVQRDLLIAAVSQGGPGKLVHPQYGELTVCTDGDIRVSHSAAEGRMCTVSFAFVEAGELSFPTSGVASGQKLRSSCDAMGGCVSDTFGKDFKPEGMADFIQKGVMGDAGSMMKFAIRTFDGTSDTIADSGRLLDGDLSVLLTPPGSGMDFVNRLQRMWRSGRGLRSNNDDLIKKIKGLSGFTAGHDLAPRGVWKTDSKTMQTQTTQRNVVAQAVRGTALTEAARGVADLPPPRPPASSVNTNPTLGVQRAGVTHPAVTALDDSIPVTPVITYEALTEVRTVLNRAFDQELLRVTDDALFLAISTVRADVNRDISMRLEQTEKTTFRTPDEVLPALVLAADWYDSAARETDITGRNPITHPGFVPVKPLQVPAR